MILNNNNFNYYVGDFWIAKANLQDTKLGWIVTGTIPVPTKTSLYNFTRKLCSRTRTVKTFWEHNEISNLNVLSQEQIKCDKLIHKNTTQLLVKLPLKRSPQELRDSKFIDLKIFHFPIGEAI